MFVGWSKINIFSHKYADLEEAVSDTVNAYMAEIVPENVQKRLDQLERDFNQVWGKNWINFRTFDKLYEIHIFIIAEIFNISSNSSTERSSTISPRGPKPGHWWK